MVDRRETEQCSNIISRSLFFRESWSSKSVTDLMAIRFTQSPLMTLSENINLEKNELENLISFKFEFYTLFFVLYFIGDIFHLCKKLRGVRCRLTKA